jgi:hypothetical protein
LGSGGGEQFGQDGSGAVVAGNRRMAGMLPMRDARPTIWNPEDGFHGSPGRRGRGNFSDIWHDQAVTGISAFQVFRRPFHEFVPVFENSSLFCPSPGQYQYSAEAQSPASRRHSRAGASSEPNSSLESAAPPVSTTFRELANIACFPVL